MAEFLIQGETLTAVADKIRSYTEESKYSINENAISNEGALAQDSVVVYYTEYVDYQQSDAYQLEEGASKVGGDFIGYGYLSNNDNVIVPVIYKDGTGEGPDLEEPFFYCGTAVVNGTTYDKWRKIETQLDGVFTWTADAKKYAYTNVIVLENGINPVDMPQRIVDVYNVGHAAGSTATDASIAEEVSEQTDLIAEIKAVANELPDATGGGGGGSSTPAASKKEVNFIDYDGTILYSYTVEETQALTELPALPVREGLTCQGWNLSLDYIKTYSGKYGVCDVGATYITDDGKTRLYIRIAAEGRMTVPLYFSQTVANGVTIDWGDGSSTQTLSGTGNVNTSHTYASIGDYVIALEVTSGMLGLGRGSATYCVMGSTGNNGRVYCNMLQKVEIGSGVTSISNYAFYYCYSLSSIVIPDSVTSIGNYAFYSCGPLSSIVISDGGTSIGNQAFRYCYSLSSIVIPDGVTSIGTHAFANCTSLSSIVIPDGVTSISNNAFYNCYSLSSIVIPDSVTSIGGFAFSDCCGMAIYDFSSHTSVPTLSGTNAFSSIPSDCIIKVPSALYNSWKAATNWATYASKIVAV